LSLSARERSRKTANVRQWMKAGDRILFGKYAGTEIKIDDVDYVIMREEEILAVLESGAKGKK
jgi:chaperonin GroES